MKDLAEGQDEMAGNIKAFGETKLSLKGSITSNEDAILIKKTELADTNEKWQLWQMDLIDIKAQLVVDVKYLKMLKERCEMMDKEWEARQKMRAEEMEALKLGSPRLNALAVHVRLDAFTKVKAAIQK